MIELHQNQAAAAQRRVPLHLVDEVDGKTPKTGLTFTAGEIRVSKNGGTEVPAAGTVVEIGAGLYAYEFTQAELDTLGFVTARVVKQGVRAFVAAHQVVRTPPDSAAIADRLLRRSIAGGADGGRTVGQALAASRNRVVVDASTTPPTLTVFDVDDSTVLWTARVTTAKGDPISGIDPA